MTLNTIIQHINLALNYPALAYQDISLYFDMAIAELNTTLHTAIPTVSDMLKLFEQKMSKEADSRMKLDVNPETSDYNIKTYATAEAGLIAAAANNVPYFYAIDTKKFYVKNKLF